MARTRTADQRGLLLGQADKILRVCEETVPEPADRADGAPALRRGLAAAAVYLNQHNGAPWPTNGGT